MEPRKLSEAELGRRRESRQYRQRMNEKLDILSRRREEQKDILRELDRERGLTKTDICNVMLHSELDEAVQSFVDKYSELITKRTTIEKFMEVYRDTRDKWVAETYNRGISTRIRASVLVYVTSKLLNVKLTYDVVGDYFNSSSCATRPYVNSILNEMKD